MFTVISVAVSGFDMPCYHPIPASRDSSGGISLRRERPGAVESLRLPCGSCIGCQRSRAREWAIRCHYEFQSHDTGCWTTLTYDEPSCPPTLRKSDLSGFIKRLRARVAPSVFRFFGSGEYGERRGRPHFHAILFGLPVCRQRDIEASWTFGNVRTYPLEARGIAYVAGYVGKKIGGNIVDDWIEYGDYQELDRSTGEVFSGRYRNVVVQKPFVLMSRRPGIGANVRDTYWRSWRRNAVYSGREVPVPRYLHEAWIKRVSPEEKEFLEWEKLVDARKRDFGAGPAAAEAIAKSQHSLQSARRTV